MEKDDYRSGPSRANENVGAFRAGHGMRFECRGQQRGIIKSSCPDRRTSGKVKQEDRWLQQLCRSAPSVSPRLWRDSAVLERPQAWQRIESELRSRSYPRPVPRVDILAVRVGFEPSCRVFFLQVIDSSLPQMPTMPRPPSPIAHHCPRPELSRLDCRDGELCNSLPHLRLYTLASKFAQTFRQHLSCVPASEPTDCLFP